MITDAFFVKALRESDVNDMVEGRIFGTVDDETEPDSASVPSLVVFYEGTQNDQEGKDDKYESEVDVDTITVGVSAKSREQLAVLTRAVRKAIRDYVCDHPHGEVEIVDYQFSAGRVSYDWEKPCWWQELTWQCDVCNELD